MSVSDQMFTEGALIKVTMVTRTFVGTVMVYDTLHNMLYLKQAASSGRESDSDIVSLNLSFAKGVSIERDPDQSLKGSASQRPLVPKTANMKENFRKMVEHRKLLHDFVERDISLEGRMIFLRLKNLSLEPCWTPDNQIIVLNEVSLSPPYRHPVYLNGEGNNSLMAMVQKAADKVFNPDQSE